MQVEFISILGTDICYNVFFVKLILTMLIRFIGNQLAPDLCIICRENKSKRKDETGYQDLITCVTEKGAVKLIEFSKSCP